MAKATSPAKDTTLGTPVGGLWLIPEAPALSVAELDAAAKAGGLAGIVRAILDKMPGVLVGDHADAANAAAGVLDQYRVGLGASNQQDVLDYLAPHVAAIEVLRQAMRHLTEWIAANPGTIVNDAGHGSNHRRVFDGHPRPQG